MDLDWSRYVMCSSGLRLLTAADFLSAVNLMLTGRLTAQKVFIVNIELSDYISTFSDMLHILLVMTLINDQVNVITEYYVNSPQLLNE